MKYSVVVDVVRNEPYAIFVENGHLKKVYGINSHSKKWAMEVNAFSNKTLELPSGMMLTKSAPMTEEIKSEFAIAFGEPLAESRRLNRRVKSILREEVEIKGPISFIFGFGLGRRRGRKRILKKLKKRGVKERKVFPVLAVKQKELFQNLYIENATERVK